MGVDQAHGAVGGSATMDPDSGASEKTCRKRQEEEERRGSTKMWGRRRTVSNEHFWGVNRLPLKFGEGVCLLDASLKGSPTKDLRSFYG